MNLNFEETLATKLLLQCKVGEPLLQVMLEHERNPQSLERRYSGQAPFPQMEWRKPGRRASWAERKAGTKDFKNQETRFGFGFSIS